MSVDLDTPQAQVARYYMISKGYRDIRPAEILKLDDLDCWYFYYELSEGDLELEVFYDHDKVDWTATVTTFALHPTAS